MPQVSHQKHSHLETLGKLDKHCAHTRGMSGVLGDDVGDKCLPVYNILVSRSSVFRPSAAQHASGLKNKVPHETRRLPGRNHGFVKPIEPLFRTTLTPDLRPTPDGPRSTLNMGVSELPPSADIIQGPRRVRAPNFASSVECSYPHPVRSSRNIRLWGQFLKPPLEVDRGSSGLGRTSSARVVGQFAAGRAHESCAGTSIKQGTEKRSGANRGGRPPKRRGCNSIELHKAEEPSGADVRAHRADGEDADHKRLNDAACAPPSN